MTVEPSSKLVGVLQHLIETAEAMASGDVEKLDALIDAGAVGLFGSLLSQRVKIIVVRLPDGLFGYVLGDRARYLAQTGPYDLRAVALHPSDLEELNQHIMMYHLPV